MDALEVKLEGFDLIHASPPCHAYSSVTSTSSDPGTYPHLIPLVRDRLSQAQVPYVIENVESAGDWLIRPIRLCGSSFGLNLRRHRLFECGGWRPAGVPPCDHSWQTPRFRSLDTSKGHRLSPVVGVHGKLQYKGEGPIRMDAMQIHWMSQKELSQAIPPAYTAWLGSAWLEALERSPE
jgi:DNA (cytosine-5)-methyltransferase 1